MVNELDLVLCSTPTHGHFVLFNGSPVFKSGTTANESLENYEPSSGFRSEWGDEKLF